MSTVCQAETTVPGLYILESGHLVAAALAKVGVTEFPALVVLDLEPIISSSPRGSQRCSDQTLAPQRYGHRSSLPFEPRRRLRVP